MSSIYVSNLSENMTEMQLIGHFSKYGFIIECRMGKMIDGKCKGYAKLTTNDKEAYRLILSSEHYFGSRKAQVEPFVREQGQAQVKDREIVQRRVCILGVPGGMDDALFKEAFKVIGEVANAYVRENKTRKKNHGFVTFVEKNIAEKALKMKYLDIPGWGRVQIREFRSKAFIKKKRREEMVKDKFAYRIPKAQNPHQFNFPFFFQETPKSYGYNPQKFLQPKNYGSPKFSAQSNFTDDSSLGSPSYCGFRKPCAVPKRPKFEESYQKQFMNSKKLKDYLKKINKENPMIGEIGKDKVQELELFYFNKKDRYNAQEKRTRYNYNCVAGRFARSVYGNHNPENLRQNSGARNCPDHSQHQYQHKDWRRW